MKILNKFINQEKIDLTIPQKGLELPCKELPFLDQANIGASHHNYFIFL